MFNKALMKSKIEEKLKGSIVEVYSPRDDNKHFALKVVWSGFSGQKLIEQHRLVYDILKQEFEMGIHSVSLKTLVEEK